MRVLVLTAAFVIPGVAYAQPLAATTDEIAHWVQPDERVIVTARIPCREALGLSADKRPLVDDAATCTVKGDFTLTHQTLSIERGRLRYTFPLGTIDRVERPKDRIWNGAAIGYLVGVVPFALMEIGCDRRDGCWEGFALAAGVVIGGPIGFGIGALTDALIRRPRLVYSRPHAKSPVASIRPIRTSRETGLHVSLVF